jgi:hypothetical protein
MRLSLLWAVAASAALLATAACAPELRPNPAFHDVHVQMIEAQKTAPETQSDGRMPGYEGVQIYNNVYMPAATGEAGAN